MRQVLFHIPGTSVPVYGFGALLLVAFFAATWLLGRLARRQGLDPQRLTDLALWIFLWGIVGARIFYMVEHPEEFDSPLSFFKIWQGGIVFYGSVMAGIVVFLYYTHVHQLPPWKVLDAFAATTALGIGIGRLGCLLNGCCWGKPTNLPWAIRFPRASIPWREHLAQNQISESAAWSAAVHPTQIYLALAGFLSLAVVMTYWRFRRRDGQVMSILMVVYAVTRFTIEYFRADVTPQFDGLTISQNISVLLFAGGVAMWIYLWRTAPSTLSPDAASSPVFSAADAERG